MENAAPEGTPPTESADRAPTPMGTVWLYVAISVVLVWAVMYTWHRWEMRGITLLQAERTADVEQSIVSLSGYRDALKAGGTTTAEAYIAARLHATSTAR